MQEAHSLLDYPQDYFQARSMAGLSKLMTILADSRPFSPRLMTVHATPITLLKYVVEGSEV